MKRLFPLLLTLLAMVCPKGATAQTDLGVAPLFRGDIIPTERIVDTRVRGKTLQRYQLTFYRSLRFTASPDEAARLQQLMELDSQNAQATVSSTKTQEKGTRRVNTFTQKVQVAPRDGKSRYLCYQEQWTTDDGGRDVTVIYMEGTVGSLEKLEKLLNQK